VEGHGLRPEPLCDVHRQGDAFTRDDVGVEIPDPAAGCLKVPFAGNALKAEAPIPDHAQADFSIIIRNEVLKIHVPLFRYPGLLVRNHGPGDATADTDKRLERSVLKKVPHTLAQGMETATPPTPPERAGDDPSRLRPAAHKLHVLRPR